MAKCQNCGQENLDFKLYCDNCGEQLKSLKESPSGKGISDLSHDNSKSYIYKLKDSKIFGVILFFSPLLLTLLTIPIFFHLLALRLVHPGLIYGFLLLIFLELIFLTGCAIFNREWRIGSIDEEIKAPLIFFLFFSLMPFIILGFTVIVGHIPIGISALVTFLIFLFLVWLMFYGWLSDRLYYSR